MRFGHLLNKKTDTNQLDFFFFWLLLGSFSWLPQEGSIGRGLETPYKPVHSDKTDKQWEHKDNEEIKKTPAITNSETIQKLQLDKQAHFNKLLRNAALTVLFFPSLSANIVDRM